MSPSILIVLSLIAGLIAGIVVDSSGSADLAAAARAAGLVGEIWLKALQMTVLPLLISLLITGIASMHDTAASGRLAARALLWFAILVTGSALLAALVMPPLLAMWPVDPASASALLAGVARDANTMPPAPPLREWFVNIVPANPFRAAADGAILPLVVFTLLFGLAVARLAQTTRAPLLAFFHAVAQAMLVVVQWVLWLAPLGVFALALGVGMRGGLSAAGALSQYLILMCGLAIVVTLAMYPIAAVFGRVPLRRFAAALAPAQVVAFSTQSSLASLPAMLAVSERGLGIPPRIAGIVLPLAVSVFKVTSPALNLAIVVFVAHVSGMALDPVRMALGVAVAILTSFGVAGIPGQGSFLTTTVPISAAMGVPMELLLLLIAIEVVPDIFRTVGNVTADVAVTAIVARGDSREEE